jgi:hypothetical protein
MFFPQYGAQIRCNIKTDKQVQVVWTEFILLEWEPMSDCCEEDNKIMDSIKDRELFYYLNLATFWSLQYAFDIKTGGYKPNHGETQQLPVVTRFSAPTPLSLLISYKILSRLLARTYLSQFSGAVSWLRRLDAGFSLQSHGFNPGWRHVRFVEDKVALE